VFHSHVGHANVCFTAGDADEGDDLAKVIVLMQIREWEKEVVEYLGAVFGEGGTLKTIEEPSLSTRTRLKWDLIAQRKPSRIYRRN
jgi:hypothetical protein